MELAIKKIVQHLDEHNGCDETEQGLRILKIGEEFGEAAAAWIGYVGQNPRKGVTAELSDVGHELADIAVTTLVALASLGFDPVASLEEKLDYVCERVGL
jgi:NTP pyrophosphatase (non-canonical NTP hydrolase)